MNALSPWEGPVESIFIFLKVCTGNTVKKIILERKKKHFSKVNFKFKSFSNEKNYFFQKVCEGNILTDWTF